jgi:hypothetical protein
MSLPLTTRALVVSGLLFAPMAFAQNTGTGGAAGSAAPTAAGSAAPGSTPPAPAAPAPTAQPAASAPTPPAPPAPPAPPVPSASPGLLTPTTAPAPVATKKSAPGTVDLSLPPSVPSFGGGTNISASDVKVLEASTVSASDEWKFEFHGYMRAPIRASLGPPSPVQHPSRDFDSPSNAGLNYVAPFAPGTSGPAGLQLHEIVRVPGSNYAAWDYTNTITGPWTQLNFSYGNSRVTTTVIVDAYNQTDGSYRNLQAQQGIDQVFLTLRFPDAFGDYGGLVWNIGTFPNRYGMSGKYDGGMYETYLFGRTHVSGETLTATLSNLDPMGDWTVTLEHGLGAKMDIVPFTNNQTYQIYGSPTGPGYLSGAQDLASQNADYLPWAGPVPQGSTYLHHAHIMAKYQKMWNFGLHYLFTWTPDDNWDQVNSRLPSSGDAVPRFDGPIQGSIAVVGGEARFTGGQYGDGYVGFSHIDGRNVNALADSLEVLHANGGPSLKQTYFGQTFTRHTGIYSGPQNESGTINTLELQYSFSFGALARAPEDWWGDGPDLVVTGFGMFTTVDSKAPPVALGAVANTKVAGDPSRATTWDMSTKKVKWGLDAIYTPLSWLGAGVRFDDVRPDLDGAYSRVKFTTPTTYMLVNPGGSDLNFRIITARLVMKTQFVTHEAVTLQYSRYFLGAAAYPADARYAWVAKADENAFELSATMWW